MGAIRICCSSNNTNRLPQPTNHDTTAREQNNAGIPTYVHILQSSQFRVNGCSSIPPSYSNKAGGPEQIAKLSTILGANGIAHTLQPSSENTWMIIKGESEGLTARLILAGRRGIIRYPSVQLDILVFN